MNEAKKSYVRFSLAQRVEHIVLVLSFSILGLTGLPQKYPLSPISQAIVDGLGGIETIRVIHRIAATVFLIEAIYHLVVLGYKLYVRRLEATMVPTIKDGTDALESIQYNLGLTDKIPKMPRYNFTEKAEYWAMLWGLFVMAVTGFILWNPIATTNFLSGEFIPAAKVAHGAEAVLAVLAIILWHFWHVHLRLFNKSIFTGRIDRHALEDEHGLELEQIESGRLPTPPDADETRTRITIFVPVASIVSVVLLVGVYIFVTFEQSSITTLPPAQQVAILVTRTPTIAPPTATPAPTQTPLPEPEEEEGSENKPKPPKVLAWSGTIGALFKQECTSCHGTVGGFSAEDYADVMKAVQPGNTADSSVIQVQLGDHPGKFTEEQLAQVVAWIEAGAPETPESGGAGEQLPSSSAAVTWSGQVGSLFSEKCGACHGSVGGFSAKTYEDVLKAIKPGSPDDSAAVTVQQDGEHPGKFTEEELQIVIDWIQAGAPE